MKNKDMEVALRRERWAWGYCVLCVLNLVYNIFDLYRGGGWVSVIIAVALFAASLVLLTDAWRRRVKASRQANGAHHK